MKRLYILISIILILVLIPLLFAACIFKVEMEGDYVAPDSLKMTMVISFLGEKFPEIELVKIGETVYAKDPETQQWMMADDVESYQEFSEIEDFITASNQFINAFKGTSLLSDEEINGVLCYHVQGAVDATKLEDSSSELASMEIETLSTELWIGKEDFLVRRMALEVKVDDLSNGAESPLSGGSFSFNYEFSKYNEPIIIEAPQLASN
jgi:hypothetical protein